MISNHNLRVRQHDRQLIRKSANINDFLFIVRMLYRVEVCGSTRTRGYTRTRPVPAGMGRVRVDVFRVGSGMGTKSTGRVYPFLPVKNTIFSRCSSYIECFFSSFLANVVVRPSVCLSVCLSSVTFVPPTQGIEIYGNVSMPFNGHLLISRISR